MLYTINLLLYSIYQKKRRKPSHDNFHNLPILYCIRSQNMVYYGKIIQELGAHDEMRTREKT